MVSGIVNPFSGRICNIQQEKMPEFSACPVNSRLLNPDWLIQISGTQATYGRLYFVCASLKLWSNTFLLSLTVSFISEHNNDEDYCSGTDFKCNITMKNFKKTTILFNLYIPEFLKTGLAKIRAHSTTWQLKAIKSVQRPIKKPISDAEQ